MRALSAVSHIALCLRLAAAGSAALVMLEYILTATYRTLCYPTQLQQAVVSLNHHFAGPSHHCGRLSRRPPRSGFAFPSYGGGALQNHRTAAIWKAWRNQSLSYPLFSVSSSTRNRVTLRVSAQHDYLSLSMVRDVQQTLQPPGLLFIR